MPTYNTLNHPKLKTVHAKAVIYAALVEFSFGPKLRLSELLDEARLNALKDFVNAELDYLGVGEPELLEQFIEHSNGAAQRAMEVAKGIL
jgi:regulator of sigma D